MRLGLWVGLVCAALVASLVSAKADERQGLWMRGDGVARVNVAPCGEALCMTNVWIKPNTESEKVGDYVRLDLRAIAPGRWKGNGHDPQRNLNFTTEMDVSGERMVTSGCVLAGMVCRSTEWTRPQ